MSGIFHLSGKFKSYKLYKYGSYKNFKTPEKIFQKSGIFLLKIPFKWKIENLTDLFFIWLPFIIKISPENSI